jgi:LuxR family transcriptional activator of conjugal transfer of Ti plasmids
VNKVFRSLIDSLDVSRDENMIKSALQSFARSCGFARFAYLQTEGPEVRAFSSYPDGWQDIYLDGSYTRIDPVVTEARRRREIFTWAAEHWSTDGSTPLRRFRDQAIDHGIRSGATIAADGSFGARMMLTFASPHRKVDFSALLCTQSALQAVLAVHYRLQQVGAATHLAPRHILSPREAVCAMWAAKGKGTADTAMLTGITQRTVQHYLDNARRKFDARTLTHLVAMAKDRGLL